MDSLKDKISILPDLPGVYIMTDPKGTILYVGKAKSLKKRVSSYFHAGRDHSPKTVSLLSHISNLDYIVTPSEMEALILENNLIKKHRPRYNVVLKDDKNYPYIRISSEEFPRLTVVRGIKKDGADYFGPYTSASSMRETLRLIRKVFPIRSCSDDVFRGRKRPCLNYQIGRCTAPCMELVTGEEYSVIVKRVRMFLDGRNKELLRELEKGMREASEILDFEEAARIRDRIGSVKKVLERQNIVSARLVDQDYISIARIGDEAQVMVLFVRGGSIIGSKSFPLSKVGVMADSEIVSSFISQFYGGEKYIPEEVVVSVEVIGKEVLEQWLSERKERSVKVLRPERGGRARVAAMGRKNAELALKERLGVERLEIKNLEDLKEALRLAETPKRIEAFDISNIGGKEAVGSMVVFGNGRPLKTDYRHFRIRTVEGSDDYGMMAEVLLRRYGGELRSKMPLPDLIMVDGGKGQLNVALSVARETGLGGVDIISLAKERDKVTDRVFIPRVKDPVNIQHDSPMLHLLQQIRDESHRFAVSHHRKLRGKNLRKSALLEIPGIGEAKAKVLLRHLGSLDKVKEADVEALSNVPGITKKDADAVWSHFHK